MIILWNVKTELTRLHWLNKPKTCVSFQCKTLRCLLGGTVKLIRKIMYIKMWTKQNIYNILAKVVKQLLHCVSKRNSKKPKDMYSCHRDLETSPSKIEKAPNLQHNYNNNNNHVITLFFFGYVFLSLKQHYFKQTL